MTLPPHLAALALSRDDRMALVSHGLMRDPIAPPAPDTWRAMGKTASMPPQSDPRAYSAARYRERTDAANQARAEARRVDLATKVDAFKAANAARLQAKRAAAAAKSAAAKARFAALLAAEPAHPPPRLGRPQTGAGKTQPEIRAIVAANRPAQG